MCKVAKIFSHSVCFFTTLFSGPWVSQESPCRLSVLLPILPESHWEPLRVSISWCLLPSGPGDAPEHQVFCTVLDPFGAEFCSGWEALGALSGYYLSSLVFWRRSFTVNFPLRTAFICAPYTRFFFSFNPRVVFISFLITSVINLSFSSVLFDFHEFVLAPVVSAANDN